MGFPYKKKGQICPTKDEMADYLERYAEHFGFPIRLGVRVTGLAREGDTYVVGTSDGSRFEAANVIVASGAHREPRVPALATAAGSLDRPDALDRVPQPDAAADGRRARGGRGQLGRRHRARGRTHASHVALRSRARPHPGGHRRLGSRHIAFHVVRFIGMHVQTIRTPMGRKARDKELNQGTMLVRVKPKQILAAGVTWVGKTTGVTDGMPTVEDGQVLKEVTTVIWCTGNRHDLSWIDLPIFEEDGRPMHDRGVVPGEPGLGFRGAAVPVRRGVGRAAGRGARRALRGEAAAGADASRRTDDVCVSARLRTIHAVANPEKLQHVGRSER